MAREKEGYRDALERVRSQAAGEMVTVAEAAKITLGAADRKEKDWVLRKFTGWTPGNHDKKMLKGVTHDTKQNDRPGAGTPERPKTCNRKKAQPHCIAASRRRQDGSHRAGRLLVGGRCCAEPAGHHGSHSA